MLQKIWNVLKSAAFWTVVFTGFLTLFTYLLYSVSKKATDATKQQARAVINFGGFGIGPAINGTNGQWMSQQFDINWRNSGTTVAKAVTFWATSKPFLGDLPDNYDFPLPTDKTQGVVAPNGTFAESILIPRDQLEDNWHGKARIFVWGAAVYNDVFAGDPPRVSEFCTELFHITAGYVTQPALSPNKSIPLPVLGEPNTAISQISWTSCSRGAHLCYDGDCSDYNERVKDARGELPSR